uniref:Uncharacterized protein n=1 Tax=viral metagenome TaxID=1070528 RepID=A0A6M3LC38_9ZZZZ
MPQRNTPLNPKQLLELIDEFYNDAVLNGLSRFDVRWGKWSYAMNREINQRIKADDPHAARLRYVTVYWVLKSQLLEVHYKKPWFGFITTRKLEYEASNIKDMILSDEPLELLDIQSLANLVLGGQNANT